jgi:hypothetical protein
VYWGLKFRNACLPNSSRVPLFQNRFSSINSSGSAVSPWKTVSHGNSLFEILTLSSSHSDDATASKIVTFCSCPTSSEKFGVKYTSPVASFDRTVSKSVGQDVLTLIPHSFRKRRPTLSYEGTGCQRLSNVDLNGTLTCRIFRAF